MGRWTLVVAAATFAVGCGDDAGGADASIHDLAVVDDMAVGDDLAAPKAGWHQLFPANDPTGPQPRTLYATAWDGKHVLLFGGSGAVGGNLNDLWSFDPAAKAWTQLVPNGTAGSPTAREAHQLAWTGARLVLFGGRSGGGAADLNGVWTWDATTGWTNAIADGAGGSPVARILFGMTWNGRHVVVYGGAGGVNDTALWGYDPTANQWSTLIAGNVSPSPGTRENNAVASSGSAVSESVDGGAANGADVLLFGGDPYGSSTNDLWSATPGGGWTMKIFQGANGSPPSRLRPIFVWDGARYLVTGGDDKNQVEYNDLWAWSPSTGMWTQLLANNTAGAPKIAVMPGVWTGTGIVVVRDDSSVWQLTP